MKEQLGFVRWPVLAALAVLIPQQAAAGDAPDVTGKWTMAVETSMGSGSPTFALAQKGEDITGTYKGQFGEAAVTGKLKGSQVTLAFTISAQGQDLKIEYVGTVDGDSMTGRVVFGDLGEGTFKGTRSRPSQP